jgi:hypothetical protein
MEFVDVAVQEGLNAAMEPLVRHALAIVQIVNFLKVYL